MKKAVAKAACYGKCRYESWPAGDRKDLPKAHQREAKRPRMTEKPRPIEAMPSVNNRPLEQWTGPETVCRPLPKMPPHPVPLPFIVKALSCEVKNKAMPQW